MAAGWFTHQGYAAGSETYGRHSTAHASVLVATLLRRVVASGGALRLAWSAQDKPSPEADEWPTAVLPRVREVVGDLPVGDCGAWR